VIHWVVSLSTVGTCTNGISVIPGPYSHTPPQSLTIDLLKGYGHWAVGLLQALAKWPYSSRSNKVLAASSWRLLVWLGPPLVPLLYWPLLSFYTSALYSPQPSFSFAVMLLVQPFLIFGIVSQFISQVFRDYLPVWTVRDADVLLPDPYRLLTIIELLSGFSLSQSS